MNNITFHLGPTINSQNKKNTTIVPTDSSRIKEFYRIKENISKFGNNEMCEYVRHNINNVLRLAIDKKPEALNIIIDKDFLEAMDMCDIELDIDYMIKFNRICRSFIRNNTGNPNYPKEIPDLMMNNAYKINKILSRILEGLGLDKYVATWLAVNRYSSTEDRRNARRLTREIQHYPESIMTEQMIINIYSKTFNEQFTNLFCSVMTDRFETFLDNNEKFVYSTVNLALLDILEQMSYPDIEDILKAYIDEIHKFNIKGRFGLMTINSADYPRINNVLEKLDSLGFEFI